jgi:serine/threonine-protein kinase HipA
MAASGATATADVWVGGRKVATLNRRGDFEHQLVYVDDAQESDFVSLTMPVRSEAWTWPHELHPFFRMNLPEGHLLGVLKKHFAPRLDGTDLTLLSLAGANSIGRVKIVPQGQRPDVPVEQFDLGALLKGDNKEEAFQELLSRHLKSAVSGVMPKFLTPNIGADEEERFRKAALITPRAIIKSSSNEFPYLALNEHLSMEVARRAGVPTARTVVSADRRVLVVERFDTDQTGQAVLGIEDFCCLLALKPDQKYDTTWERIARQLMRYIPARSRRKQLDLLIRQIVLSYVVRNADFHAKNVALLYSTVDDVALAPMYDVVTTVVYDGYRNGTPGLSLGGKKTWAAGKSLPQFAAAVCGLAPREYKDIVEQTCQAASDVARDVVREANEHPGFHEFGKRMGLAWEQGIREITGTAKANARALDSIQAELEAARFSAPKPEPKRMSVGRSELLARR